MNSIRTYKRLAKRGKTRALAAKRPPGAGRAPHEEPKTEENNIEEAEVEVIDDDDKNTN